MKRTLALLMAISCVFVTFASCTKSNQKSENSSSKYSYSELAGNDSFSDSDHWSCTSIQKFDGVQFYLPLSYLDKYTNDNEMVFKYSWGKITAKLVSKQIENLEKNQYLVKSNSGFLLFDIESDSVTEDMECLQKTIKYNSTPTETTTTTTTVTTTTPKPKMPFKKGEGVDVWGTATYTNDNKFHIDADSGWLVDCSNVEDFTKLELLVDGENVTFTGKVIGEYKIKFEKVKVNGIAYDISSFKKISIGEQNALNTANSYLKYSSFSRKGLIEQLEFEGFSNSEATYAVDNCGADWFEQAEKTAINYMEYSSFSRQSLIEQLEFEGFTHEQAVQGVTAVGY